MPTTIDLEAVSRAPVSREPYDYVLGSNVLRSEVIDDLRRDFPPIEKSGYLTVDEVTLKGRFKTLIEELEGPDFTEALSQKFGRDLHPYPRLTTIMKRSATKHGNPHTDGEAKIMTTLVYMNDAWESDGGGRLRVLYGMDVDKFATEVPPTMGTFFSFLRSDKSWHGHRPFAGERKVVQIAWVQNEAELERKKKRNAMAQMLKGVFGS